MVDGGGCWWWLLAALCALHVFVRVGRPKQKGSMATPLAYLSKLTAHICQLALMFLFETPGANYFQKCLLGRTGL